VYISQRVCSHSHLVLVTCFRSSSHRHCGWGCIKLTGWQLDAAHGGQVCCGVVQAHSQPQGAVAMLEWADKMKKMRQKLVS
jgi:hypothetical protein